MRMTLGHEISKRHLRRVRLDSESWASAAVEWRLPRDFMRQEGERYAEDVDVLRLEQAGLRVDFVGGAAQAAAHDLLAQELAGEGPQAHDVRDRLGVPALGEHAHGNHILNLLTRFAELARRYPPSGAAVPPAAFLVSLRFGFIVSASSSPLRLPRPLRPFIVASAPSAASASSRTLESMCSVLSGSREFVNVNLLVVEGVFDARRGLGAVATVIITGGRCTPLFAQSFAVSASRCRGGNSR